MASKQLRITVNAGERAVLLAALHERARGLLTAIGSCQGSPQAKSEKMQAHIVKMRKQLSETDRMLTRVEYAEEVPSG